MLCGQNVALFNVKAGGGGYRPQIPVLSVVCPQLNLLNPPPGTKFLGTPLVQYPIKVS